MVLSPMARLEPERMPLKLLPGLPGLEPEPYCTPTMVPDLLASRIQGKVTKYPEPLVLGSPAEASFLRVQPPRSLSREQWDESGGEGWSFGGRNSET